MRTRSRNKTDLTAFTQAFSCSYFMFDLLVVLHHKPLDLKFLAHAIVCGSAYWLAQVPYFNYYTIRFLLFELSTPFLNIRNALVVADANETLKFISTVLFGLSFVGCRIVYGIPTAIDFVMYLLSLIEQQPEDLSVPVLYFSVFAISSMSLLNVVWFVMAAIAPPSSDTMAGHEKVTKRATRSASKKKQ